MARTSPLPEDWASGAHAAGRRGHDAGAAMSELARLSLLIVDDNPQMRTILGSVLLAIGVRDIAYAPNGRAGLDMVQTASFDIIFADYEMPVMNGLDFIRGVRAEPGERRFTPVIMLTGHSDLRHILAARDAGMTEFLGKPVTARDILDKLKAVIQRPRPFIEATSYFGPDRRRRHDAAYVGPKRRQADLRPTHEL